VYLNHRDQAGAEALAQAVSDPDSATYRQYLSPDQVRDRFAATQDTVNAVKTWLSGSGFKVGDVPSNRAYVEASGTADEVQKAFAVTLGKYAVKGQTLRAADKNLSVPANLAGAVVGADGKGTTIAIVDAFASPTIFADASEYARRNDPAHPLKNSQFRQHVFPENVENEELCDASGWYGEETLDVEAAHGLAPGAD